ncbi:thiamine phosphate synthase [Litoreibacter roseus]|uniref:Thiamine-phosphate synthase n=1 Tax=Litoreibacter roseus TaxID=2601869 RepID=A0A6N6JI98_9RHOB|nr:thiamine phosphate synthase [Litoreibacter roseus]GFE65996.1 thiamine-phosphate synthase [Litoreibacter roseus]
MALDRSALRLYLVTDTTLCGSFGVARTVAAAVKGGVTMVQLRDKTATPKKRNELANALKTLLKGTGVPFIVNDDVETAIAVDADGVHVGQDDTPAAVVRARIGADKILGLSCETEETVRAAKQLPVDYLGLGPVFETGTKPDHKPPLSMDGLAKLCGVSGHPTVAIGGLSASHATQVLQAGADGMAVVSAICGQPDPAEAARKISQHLKGA